jgi:hypothetical protein
VDAATTGYAFVLRRILEKNGLAEGDYTLERVGGTAARAEALMQGKTGRHNPHLAPRDRARVARLSAARECGRRHRSVPGGPRRRAPLVGARERGALVGYIRGYVEAIDWLIDPREPGGGGRDLPEEPAAGDRGRGAQGVGGAPRKR